MQLIQNVLQLVFFYSESHLSYILYSHDRQGRNLWPFYLYQTQPELKCFLSRSCKKKVHFYTDEN